MLWVQQAAATAALVINVLLSGHLAELYNHNSHQAHSWHWGALTHLPPQFLQQGAGILQELRPRLLPGWFLPAKQSGLSPTVPFELDASSQQFLCHSDPNASSKMEDFLQEMKRSACIPKDTNCSASEYYLEIFQRL